MMKLGMRDDFTSYELWAANENLLRRASGALTARVSFPSAVNQTL